MKLGPNSCDTIAFEYIVSNGVDLLASAQIGTHNSYKPCCVLVEIQVS